MSSSVPASMSPHNRTPADMSGEKVVVAGPAGPVLSALVRSFRSVGAETVKLVHSAPGKHGRSRLIGGPEDPPATHVVDLTSPAVAEHLSGAAVVVLDCVGPDPDADLDRIPRLRRRELVAVVGSLVAATRRETARRDPDTAVAGGQLRTGPDMASSDASPHLIVITSTWVLDHEEPRGRASGTVLRRDDPVGLPGDLVAVEHALAMEADPALRTTVVRPAPLVGPTLLDEAVADALADPGPRARAWNGDEGGAINPRGLRRGRPATPRAVGWPDQYCHVDDLASAVRHVAQHSMGPEVPVGSAPVHKSPRGPRDSQGEGITAPSPPAVETAELDAAGWACEYDDAACRRLVAARLADASDTSEHRLGGRAAGVAVTVTLTALAIVSARRRR